MDIQGERTRLTEALSQVLTVKSRAYFRRTADAPGVPRAGPAPRPSLGYVSISDRGLILKGSPSPCWKAPKVHERGEITRFSPKSARRLRKLLMTQAGPEDWYVGGLSLTVPGPVVGEEEFRRLFHSWRMRVQRVGAVVVWRVELQQRKAAHVHAVVWAPKFLDYGLAGFAWNETLGESGSVEWRGKVYGSRYSVPGAREHALSFDMLKVGDGAGWFKYLACHTSKSKQAQLGWKGRQWGVWGGNRLRSTVQTARCTEAQFNKMRRVCKRAARLRRTSGHGENCFFMRPATQQALTEWALRETGARAGFVFVPVDQPVSRPRNDL